MFLKNLARPTEKKLSFVEQSGIVITIFPGLNSEMLFRKHICMNYKKELDTLKNNLSFTLMLDKITSDKIQIGKAKAFISKKKLSSKMSES